MRDKIKPGVYAILSAVALCIRTVFSYNWRLGKTCCKNLAVKEQAFVIVILLMILYKKSWSIYISGREMDNTYISSVFFLLYAYRKKFFLRRET